MNIENRSKAAAEAEIGSSGAGFLGKVIGFSVKNRWLVVLIALGTALYGLYDYRRLPIDAVPDITNVQVQVNSEAPGFSPVETEQRVTYPIETAMAGLPRLEEVRSLSRYGLSQVTIIFEDGVDIFFARQLVSERIQEARGQLPPGVETAMGPISTGLGEIYQWTVEADAAAMKADGTPYTPTDLKTLQDWVIKPQLRSVPGVAEVNATGGHAKQFHITPDPLKMASFGISFRDLAEAVMRNNENVGAGYIEKSGEQYLLRTPGRLTDMEDIRQLVVKRSGGSAVRVRDVAEVGLGLELRTGSAVKDGRETVLGTAIMLMGENSRAVSRRVDEKMKEVRRSLPAGVRVNTVYDRTVLVDKTMATVKKSLFEGAVLVIVVLFLFLGNFRAAILTALVIPLSMLFTITGMVEGKVSGNLMSLGAIDFGIIVDGAVIIVENCLRRLGESQHAAGRLLALPERLKVVAAATREMVRPSVFGVFIIMAVYLPILTLTGVEGKMFHPMAFTVLCALFGALILSITLVPAGAAILFSGRIAEKENPVIRRSKRIYEPLLDLSLRNRSVTLVWAAVLALLSALLFTRLGSEFIPSLDEGDIALHAMRIPSTSLTQSTEMQKVVEKRISSFPEVRAVFSKIGTPEIATDPMPPNVADCFVMLKPKKEWPDPHKPKAVLVAEMQEALERIPGNNYEFTQPIQMRFNELISGVRSDVGVKVFGDDMETLQRTASSVASALSAVPGAADVKVEQVGGLPLLTVEVDRLRLAVYGLDLAEVQEAVRVAVGGETVGEIFEGDRRHDIVIRLPEHLRADLAALENLPLPLPEDAAADEAGGASFPGDELANLLASGADHRRNFIPLGAVAKFAMTPGPNQVSRENGKRRVVATANVRGRDLGSFMAEAQRAVEEKVKLPEGYWTSWGGQFEQLLSARQRLRIVTPVVLLLVLLLLFMSLGSLKDSLLVFTGIPLALTGGVLALWLRAIPVSISAGVGFIALSGIAVLNGLVMVSSIQTLRREGFGLDAAIREGSLGRLRPVLMTALVASLGFVPMALATGTGAEVQRPLATVVIGGILSSTFLTLVVLPAAYRTFHRESEADGSPETGVQRP